MALERAGESITSGADGDAFGFGFVFA
jgi:hypothetical protein